MVTTDSKRERKTPLRRAGYYGHILLLALLPLLAAVSIRLIFGEERCLEAVSELRSAFFRGGFWAAENDMTWYLIIMRDFAGLIILYTLACIIGWVRFIWILKAEKKRSIILLYVPFTVLTLSALITWASDILLASYDVMNRMSMVCYYVRYLYGIYPIILYGAIFAGFIAFVSMDIRASRKAQIPT